MIDHAVVRSPAVLALIIRILPLHHYQLPFAESVDGDFIPMNTQPSLLAQPCCVAACWCLILYPHAALKWFKHLPFRLPLLSSSSGNLAFDGHIMLVRAVPPGENTDNGCACMCASACVNAGKYAQGCMQMYVHIGQQRQDVTLLGYCISLLFLRRTFCCTTQKVCCMLPICVH